MPFVKKLTPVEGAPATAVCEPAKTVRDHQRESARASKQVEEISCQLDDAREELKQISRNGVADEHLDLAAVGASMAAIQGKISMLEKMVEIAKQQQGDAEDALKHAALDARREVEAKDLAKLEKLAQAIDTWLTNGIPLFEQYEAQRKAVLFHGNHSVNQKVHDANLSFSTYLFRSCGQMAGCRNSYTLFQTDPKWAAPWSTHHPRPEDAR